MNRLEKMLSKWNFKKIAVWYLVLAVVAGLICGGTVGYLYRQRLKFAWQYARLEEAKTQEALRTAADKTAAASEDVVDILVVDENQQILYSAKDSKFAAGPLTLTKVGDAKKYLASADYPDAVFLQVKGDEFMLNSIVSHDFGKIRKFPGHSMVNFLCFKMQVYHGTLHAAGRAWNQFLIVRILIFCLEIIRKTWVDTHFNPTFFSLNHDKARTVGIFGSGTCGGEFRIL